MLSVTVKNDSVILDICLEDEEGGGDCVEGEGWLPSLALLRQDILKKDFRLLYLAWLKVIRWVDYEDYDYLTEPVVPYDLNDLSTPLKDFIELFEIDKNLLKAASKNSSKGNSSSYELENLIIQLSPKERDIFLLRVVKGEPNVDVHLLNRLHELKPEKIKNSLNLRKVSEIIKIAKDETKKEKEKIDKLAEEARIKKLEDLKLNEAETWTKVTDLISRKKTNYYDEAVKLLINLRDLAKHYRKTDQFQKRIDELHKQYFSLSSLKAKFNEAGLI